MFPRVAGAVGAVELSVCCRHAIYTKSQTLASDRLLSCCDVTRALHIKRETGSAAAKEASVVEG